MQHSFLDSLLLCSAKPRWSETRSKQGCVTEVMHEWLFLLSEPPPPLKDAVEDVKWAELSSKPSSRIEGNSIWLWHFWFDSVYLNMRRDKKDFVLMLKMAFTWIIFITFLMRICCWSKSFKWPVFDCKAACSESFPGSNVLVAFSVL